MELTDIIRSLPHNGPGVRLPRGLGLRLSRYPGVMVLGCSRIGVRPAAGKPPLPHYWFCKLVYKCLTMYLRYAIILYVDTLNNFLGD